MAELRLQIERYEQTERSAWDYSVRVGNRTYPTRPVRWPDVNVLAAINARAEKAVAGKRAADAFKALADLRGFALSIFPADKPPVDEWPVSALLAIVKGWAGHFQAKQRGRG